jgi:hypothetical protein
MRVPDETAALALTLLMEAVVIDSIWTMHELLEAPVRF